MKWKASILALLPALWLMPLAYGDAYYTFLQLSQPQGIIANSNSMVAPGTTVQTLAAPLYGSGYCFGYWTINDQRVSDSLGQAATIASFTLYTNTTAIAWYFPSSQDTNSDGVPDYPQWYYYGSLTNGPASDTDEDGFAFGDELERGYSPVIADEIADGGIMMRMSDVGIHRDEAQMKRYEIRSDPQGTVALQTGYVTNGTPVATPAIAYGASNFGYWEVNGVRQADGAGSALPRVMLPMTNDTVAIARFFAGGDNNGNGLEDGYEWFWFGNTNQTLASNPDGDGFTITNELERGYSPVIADEIADGGIMMRMSDVGIHRDEAQMKRYEIRSDPQGTVALQTGYVTNGTPVATPAIAYGASNFGYWEVNGVRQADGAGSALPRVMLPMTNDTVAIARFFAGGDNNGNGLEDGYEWFWFGNTNQTLASNPDGDGFTITNELERGYSPVIADEIADGGIMMRMSDVGIHRDEAQMKRYEIRSDPQGTVALQTGYVTNGTPVATPAIAYGASNFGYWEVNGVRQADGAGSALPRVMLPMTNDTVAIARFFAGGDNNGNGLEDGYEWFWFGNTNQTLASNPDGDGFTITNELERGYSPVIADEIADGGIMMRMSDVGTVGLSYYPRITQVLVNGQMQTGFMPMGGVAGALSVLSNSAPAAGDWNGDGVQELAIGGANGVLKFYQNSGSPIVPNFVEDNLSETAYASAWTNLSFVAPALGDWSGDGQADLALGGGTNVITFISSVGGFSNSAAGNRVFSLSVSGTLKTIPALAQTTTNTRCDLYVLRDNGTVDEFPNTGIPAQPFSSTNRLSNLLGVAVPNATGLAVADMNNDGFLDVLVSDNAGSIYEFRGRSNGSFLPYGPGFAGSYSGFAGRLTLAACDMYGNGSLDLIGGYAEGGLVYLKNPAPHLRISPPSVTVVGGQGTVFKALNGSGVVTWSLVRNNSGGSIDPTNGSYQSGLAGSGMDYLAAVDAAGLQGRAYVNVINTNDLASFGKAIVIGGGRDLGDPVWLATDYIANKAYNVLRYKGYARENLRYLSFNPGRDIDGDGLDNDITGFSSLTNTASVFTNWVGNANRLFVYLVDHGSATPDGAYFRLNTGENLTSAQLNTWLTAIQNQYHTEVVVVLDFCYAGRFMQDLAYAGPAKRVVIAATSANELTYFLSGGYVSFSDLFLSGLMQGMDLQQSFLLAQSGMQAYQNPTLDDTGDGLYQSNVDGLMAATIPIGATRLAGKDVPIIGGVAPSLTLTSGTTATLWAERIQSYYPLERVYATVLPPGFTANTNVGVPVTGVSEVELQPDASGHYQTSFNGFTESGAYRINYYARDIWGSVSPPMQGLVTQQGFDERMILVTGGSTNDAPWNATVNMSVTAYRTALARRLEKAHIQYLSQVSQDGDGDGTNDVNAIPTLATLGNAITNWAGPSSRLTVCLIGSTTTNGQYRLNATETLIPTQLESWLNAFQASNRSVTVVMDFDGSGSYVPFLVAPGSRERIVMASTAAGKASMRASGGLVSFSQFFLNGILNGQSLGEAFNAARNPVRYASGQLRQAPQLDDTGNGLANEKNADGLVAALRYLGAVFATGEDTPYIGSVTPATNVVQGTAVLLWAQGILSGVGISNVWCVITPPDYDGTGELLQTNLTWNAGTSRYEAGYPGFTLPGTYVCTLFAQDNHGQVSSARQSEITVTDAYEPDDTPLLAAELQLSVVQMHNFHSAVDEDWVRFYAPTGYVYELKAEQLGTNSDVALDLYYEQADGSLSAVDGIDDHGWGTGVIEMLAVDLKTGTSGRSSGIYYLRISSADTNRFGPGSGYQVQIYCPVGGAGGVVLIQNPGGLFQMGSFNVYLGAPPALAAGAGWWLVQLTNEVSYFSDNEGIYSVPASPNYTLTFKPIPGFQTPANRPLTIYADQVTSVLAYYLYTNQSPQALNPAVNTNGALQLTFLGHAGNRYAIEESTNLLDWVSLVTNTVPLDGLLRFSWTNAPAQPCGFYRTRLVP